MVTETRSRPQVYPMLTPIYWQVDIVNLVFMFLKVDRSIANKDKTGIYLNESKYHKQC